MLAAVRVGRLKDQGLATPETIRMITRRNCDQALQEAFGGNTASEEYMVIRQFANLVVTQTYGGQRDIHSESSPCSSSPEIWIIILGLSLLNVAQA